MIMDTKLFSCLDQRKCGTAEKVLFLYRGDFFYIEFEGLLIKQDRDRKLGRENN